MSTIEADLVRVLALAQVVSENLTDAETRRWAAAGFDLVFGNRAARP